MSTGGSEFAPDSRLFLQIDVMQSVENLMRDD